MSLRRSLLGLGALLATTHSAGLLGTLLSRRSMPDYYQGLNKPSWSPPARVFGPVWTLLYTMMGIAGWMLWRQRDKPAARRALTLYASQLALNAAWSPIFFRLRKPRAALYDLGALWVAIAALTAVSWKVNRRATILLMPYLAWTTFAGALNKKIVDMNPQMPRTAQPAEPAHQPT